jgi:hypothetical protein
MSASEPPYPPGRQAPPAALPARPARALPAAPTAPPPAGTGGDEVDDATIPRSAIQRTTQAGASGPGGQPGGYPGMTGGYAGQGNNAGGPQDAGDWFNRTTAPQTSGQGQPWQDFAAQGGPGPATDFRQDGYGPGAFGGNAGAPGAGMPGGYPGVGPGYQGQQPGYQGQQPGGPRAALSHLRNGNRAATPGSVPPAGISTSRQPARVRRVHRIRPAPRAAQLGRDTEAPAPAATRLRPASARHQDSPRSQGRLPSQGPLRRAVSSRNRALFRSPGTARTGSGRPAATRPAEALSHGARTRRLSSPGSDRLDTRRTAVTTRATATRRMRRAPARWVALASRMASRQVRTGPASRTASRPRAGTGSGQAQVPRTASDHRTGSGRSSAARHRTGSVRRMASRLQGGRSRARAQASPEASRRSSLARSRARRRRRASSLRPVRRPRTLTPPSS